jgi:hypothetical protein
MAKIKTDQAPDTAAVLADLKRREKRGVYGEMTLDVPYSLFEDFLDNIMDQLGYEVDLDELGLDSETIKVRADVRTEFERQLAGFDYDDLTGYGLDFDYDFVEGMFESDLEKARELQEKREEEEAEQERLEQVAREAAAAARKATLTTIEVSRGNYEKATAVLKAAGLL